MKRGIPMVSAAVFAAILPIFALTGCGDAGTAATPPPTVAPVVSVPVPTTLAECEALPEVKTRPIEEYDSLEDAVRDGYRLAVRQYGAEVIQTCVQLQNEAAR